MSFRRRQIAILLACASLATTLSGCSTINEKMSGSMGEYIPMWAGGLPPDAPPRPGTAKYDEFMRERERQRLMPADQRDPKPTKPDSSGLDPVH